MTRANFLPPLLAAAALLAAGHGAGQARAEMVGFSYSWSVPASPLTGTNPATPDGASTGGVTFTAAEPGTFWAEFGAWSPALIPGATVTTSGTASDSPDSFAAPFALTLRLTDLESGLEGEVTFTGAVTGTLTATASDLVLLFDEPYREPELALGRHDYRVFIDPILLHLPAPGAPSPAAIDAGVRVDLEPLPPTLPPWEDEGDPELAPLPEPATLVSSLLGLACCLGAAAWRRRARRRHAAPAGGGGA